MKHKVSSGKKIVCLNRKASFDYFFKEIFEAGICLKGSEVKSLREGRGNITDSYAVDKGGEIFLLDMGKPMKIKKLAEQMILLNGLSIKNKLIVDFFFNLIEL